MSELGPEARSILDAARAGDEPNDDDRRRVRAKVMRRVGIGVAVATTTTAASTAAAGTSTVVAGAGLSALGKLAFVAVGLVVVSGGAYAVHEARQRHAVQPPAIASTMSVGSATIVAPPVVIAPTIAPTMAPTMAPTASPSTESLAPKTTTPSVKKVTSTMDAEIDLLQQANAGLASGNYARALALYDEHAAKFPNGALSQERAGGRAIALCGLGRADARANAERFVEAHPDSPLVARVKPACGLE